MNKDDRIYVAGHHGLVGSAIVRKLAAKGFGNLICKDRSTLDLTRQADVESFFECERPAYIFLAAAKVGGIQANSSYPAEFIKENLLIQSNVINSAHMFGARKLVFLGSSCIYPRDSTQPISEDSLLSGALEPTNEWYAVAKIAGVKMCQAYRRQYGLDAICLMPTNLYGQYDNFDLEESHVIPALIRKFHEARTNGEDTVVIWGTGTPRREFLHADDMADAAVFLAGNYSDERILNVGTGQDISILELAQLVARITGFKGELILDKGRPDGTPRKILDVSRLHAIGWRHRIGLEEGLRKTYQWYRDNAETTM